MYTVSRNYIMTSRTWFLGVIKEGSRIRINVGHSEGDFVEALLETEQANIPFLVLLDDLQTLLAVEEI